MRVVIAEDSVLLREGLTRLLTDRGHDVVAGVGDAEALIKTVARAGRRRARCRTWWSRTYGCRRRTPTRACGPRSQLRRGPPGTRGAGAVAVRGGAVRHRAAGRVAAGASATCSRTGWPTCGSSWTRWCGWPQGGTALDPEVVAQLLGRSRKQDVLAGLTPREREVLGLMAEGRTNSAVAQQLVVSDGAVEKHVSNIFLKLGLSPSDGDHRRVLAVLTYLNS